MAQLLPSVSLIHSPAFLLSSKTVGQIFINLHTYPELVWKKFSAKYISQFVGHFAWIRASYTVNMFILCPELYSITPDSRVSLLVNRIFAIRIRYAALYQTTAYCFSHPTGDFLDSVNMFIVVPKLPYLPVHAFFSATIEYLSSVHISPGMIVWNSSVYLLKTPLLYKGLKNTYVFITHTFSFPPLPQPESPPVFLFSFFLYRHGSYLLISCEIRKNPACRILRLRRVASAT